MRAAVWLRGLFARYQVIFAAMFGSLVFDRVLFRRCRQYFEALVYTHAYATGNS